ncbi:MAG: hypothetical protein J3R72DRAFT_79120 [Linnemannia gamsii]|nr:MAG: hypothetical protein J3R72DRAFT_79120 [Linnemannia gamsii]
MGAVGIRRLRIWILLLTIASLVLSCVCLAGGDRCSIRSDLGWFSITLSIVIILSYSYSLKGKPIVGRFVRAFCIFVLFGLTVVNSLLFGPSYPDVDFFGCSLLGPGLFMLIDMGWTLRDTRLKQPSESQEFKESPDVIIISPEIPHRDGTAVSPTQYVYPPLSQHLQPRPQEFTADTYHITMDPLPLEVKGSPQSQPEKASPHLAQNREAPKLSRPSQPTTLPSLLAPQLMPQAPQFYGTPQPQPEMASPHWPQDREIPQPFQPQPSQPTTLLSPLAPQLLPQAPQFYGAP